MIVCFQVAESRFYKNQNYTLSYIPNPHCPWTCELTNDVGYVVYSALGSFFIPMFVMLFFYWRIYKAAVRTTKAINRGFKTTKSKQKIFIKMAANISQILSVPSFKIHSLNVIQMLMKNFQFYTYICKYRGYLSMVD